MTIPTGVSAGHVGMAGVLDKAVTVAAIQPELVDMQTVVVGNRLGRLVAHPHRLWSGVLSEGRRNAKTDRT